MDEEELLGVEIVRFAHRQDRLCLSVGLEILGTQSNLCMSAAENLRRQSQ